MTAHEETTRPNARPMRAVLFDFDYTLADSSRGAERCINHALAEVGYPLQSYEAICRTIGMSLERTFALLAEEQSSQRLALLGEAFIRAANIYMEPLTTLFPGTASTIRELRARGLRTGIVSTKFRYRIDNILTQHGLRGDFDVIVGGEDVSVAKPHPTGAFIAVTKLQVHPSDVLYVGDGCIDAELARNGGFSFAAVLTGTTTREEFHEYEPVAFLSMIEEVLDLAQTAPPRLT